MRVKTTFTAKYVEISLFQEEQELIKAELSPEQYCPLLPFSLEVINVYNGIHNVLGTWEYLTQSDMYVEDIWNGKDVMVSVTHVD